MLLNALLLVIFFACVACLYTEGLWGNAIGLINVVTSALLATNFFEPLAGWMEKQAPSFSYVWDFLALWGLFGLFVVVFRVATDLLSKVKVRFLKIADQIGGAVLSLWTAWVIVCFTAMSLHTAPLRASLSEEASSRNNACSSAWPPTGNGSVSCKALRSGSSAAREPRRERTKPRCSIPRASSCPNTRPAAPASKPI